MAKTEVYSWRVATDLKTGLEREARRRKLSLSAVLDEAAKEWLDRRSGDEDDLQRQRRLHKAAEQCIGAFAGTNPRRAAMARQLVRDRLRRKYAR